MNRATLHIKGNEQDAMAELKRRDFDGELFATTMNGCTVIVPIMEDRQVLALHAWYGEDNKVIKDYGYPPGTLLHFSFKDRQS